MADIFLRSGETFTGIANPSNFYGKGGAGTETAGITVAALGSRFDQNIEAVTLVGNTSDFKFQQQGNQLLIYTLSDALVATIGIQDDANGTLLNFSNNQGMIAMFDGATLEINGAAISTTPGTIA